MRVSAVAWDRGGDTMRVGRSGARMRTAGWGGLFGFLDLTRPRLNDDDYDD